VNKGNTVQRQGIICAPFHIIYTLSSSLLLPRPPFYYSKQYTPVLWFSSAPARAVRASSSSSLFVFACLVMTQYVRGLT